MCIRDRRTGGYAKVLEKYDPRGNCTEVAYRDENDRPCLLKDGYAKLSFQYADRLQHIFCYFYKVIGFINIGIQIPKIDFFHVSANGITGFAV